ncbi:PD-(D/E)XK nuclease family protein [candidate division WOR-3 bacterium]|nr:PD-(D/E)XK nuclease family protein [candidate division WOR-3 bacterium]
MASDTMPLEGRVKIIPIEQPFLRVLAGYVKERFGSRAPDFSDVLMVFPSQRNKFYFRRYLLETAGRPGIMPPVMKTLDELVEYCYECLGGKPGMVLHGIERNLLLKSTIDRLKVEFWKDLPFLRFVAVGNRFLDFIDEMAQERVTFESIERETELGHYPEKYVQNELPVLKRIYEEYRDALKQSGYQDPVDVNTTSLERFDAACLERNRHVMICGLAATTAVEAGLIEKILCGLPSELVLHSCRPDELEGMNDPGKPFYIHNKLLRGMGVDIPRIGWLRGESVAEPVVHVKELKSETQQTLHLHSVISACAAKYQDLRRIGIVLADESIMYSVRETLRICGIPYNLSAGLPIAQSVLYSLLGQLYEVIRSDYHYEEFFAFIRHPLFKNAVMNGQTLRPLIYGLENFMIAQRLNFFERDRVYEDRFDPLIGLVHRGISRALADLPLQYYVEGLLDYLNELLGYNKPLLETNPPDISELFDQLHRLSALRMAAQIPARGADMLEFILSVLEGQRYRVEGDPMRGVQIIGSLEARNLDFDCLIVPSMNEGVFPRRSEKDMFINQEVRGRVGLPVTQERENLYYYYFTALLKGKREVYLSYVAEQDKEVASRFINLALPNIARDNAQAKLAATAFKTARRAVNKSPDISKGLYQYLQNSGLSPTALSDYRKCPYRYFLRFILRISEPDEITEEPGPAEWGEIVHGALKQFYKIRFPDGFVEKDLDRATAAMDEELDEALRRNRNLARKPHASARLDLNLYKRRMRNFLKREIERFHEGFAIHRSVLEKKAVHHLAINAAQVVFSGYIDRVDVLDGKYYIIDYKTGKIPERKNFEIGDDFNEFQLPLYALMFSMEQFEMIGGMMYYEIGRDSRTVDIVKGQDAAAYLNDFRQKILVPTIKEMLDPEVAFYQTADDDHCRHCPYAQICGAEHGR